MKVSGITDAICRETAGEISKSVYPVDVLGWSPIRFSSLRRENGKEMTEQMTRKVMAVTQCEFPDKWGFFLLTV